MSESVFRVVQVEEKAQVICNGAIHVLLLAGHTVLSAAFHGQCPGDCKPMDVEPLSFGQAVAEYLGTAKSEEGVG